MDVLSIAGCVIGLFYNMEPPPPPPISFSVYHFVKKFDQVWGEKLRTWMLHSKDYASKKQIYDFTYPNSISGRE